MRPSYEDVLQKHEHPQKGSNWLSLITFYYTIPIFREGRKRDLNEFDLTKPLDEHKSSILGDKMAIIWSNEVLKAQKHKEVPSLTKVLFRPFLKDIILQGILLFIMEIAIRMFQPLFLGLLLRYFDPDNEKNKEPIHQPLYLLRLFWYYTRKGQSPILKNEAYVYACGIVLCNMLNVLIIHPCMMSILHVGMKLRIGACSLIYRKTLRVDLTSLSGPTVGTVVNLMSNDVNRFDTALLHFHYLWLAPVQMILCLYFIYREVEISAVVGISAILVFIPLQAWFGNQTSIFRLMTAIRTDERVRQMNEIVQGMQVIKMYTWEYAFAEQVHRLRKLEIDVVTRTSYIRGTILSFLMFTTRLSIFLTVVSYVLRDKGITAEKVFVIISYYQLLRQTMTLFFPNAIAQIAETNVAISRIKKFMMLPECQIGDPTPLHPEWQTKKQEMFYTSSREKSKRSRISITNVSAKIEDEECLQGVTLEMKEGDLCAVIGQVGSGKSALLNLILGELQPCVGKIQVDGVISFAAQEAWLFAGSVRQNILFGREYNRVRYREVVQACALVRDFQLLPYGDQTIVGEKGISLSGGQRARINLARAVYKEADIYLLDDPLSAVDTHVGKHLFEKCISEYLSGKLVILVTHQLQFLSDIKNVILMDSGKVAAVGSYKKLETSGLDFSEFLKKQLSVESEPESTDKVDTIIKSLRLRSSLHMNVIDVEGEKFKPTRVEEMRSHGSVECFVYKEYFKAGGNCCYISTVVIFFFMAQAVASTSDFFLSEWVNTEEIHNSTSHRGTPIWGDMTTQTAIIIYSSLIGSTIVISLVRSFLFFILCMRASQTLHDRMFNRIIKASMKFFNTNTSGTILNRFSKDLGAVDEFLPYAMIDCAQIMLNLVGAVAVVSSVNYYLLIPTFFMCILFYILRRFYLQTSRSIKRLEGITKSPVIAHLNATIQGIETIRSNGAGMLLTREFDQYQDTHSSAWYMFLATSRAFGYWLDLICAVFIGVTTLSFLFFPTNASKVGLAITQVIGLSGLFQWGMKQSAEMENQMTSVERVLEFTTVEQEPDLESAPDKKPPPEWPTNGRVQFQNLVMKYKEEDPPVLKSLNFVIQPKEKIGIVGRTGAGKSSLIAALFRLSPFEGGVIIDGIQTKEIGLHDLRKKISIIPQEPVLFSGTLRYNMDPFNQFDDTSIVQALTVVEIKAAIQMGNGCLKYHVSEGGVNISVGERQMICLARAILRNNLVLVLDEATANVDPKTDQFIQTTIRKKFAKCTVLTIAHRLHTIMDSDRVLVMDAGSVVEFDHPHTLLQKKAGYLSQMVQKTGKAMAQNLQNIARESFEKKTKK